MKDLERNNIIFGAAYYPEYMPFERLQEDIAMMQEAGMNTVRIAESTWSTLEPVEGKFDFSYVDKVLAAVEKAGMYTVIGTPTYAIPSWYLLVTQEQNMDGARSWILFIRCFGSVLKM